MRSKLRKSISLLLAVVMVIAGLGITSAQNVKAADKPTFTVKTSAATAKPGDIIEAELWLESGSDMEFFVLNYQYDTNIYEYVSRSKGELIRDMERAFIEYDEGNISIMVDLTECSELGLEPYGQVYKLKLKVKEDAVGAGNFGIAFCGGTNTDGSTLEATNESVDVVVKDQDNNIIEDGNLPIIIELQSLALNKTAPFTMEKGTEDDLTVTATPANALIGKTVTWSSSNNNAVTVDAGHITAVGVGEATITAEVEGKKASVKVTVNAPLKSISLNKQTLALRKGAFETLTVSYNPTDTTDSKTVTWTSEDKTVATVDTTGKVTALKNGTTKITATVGDKTAECTVTVKEEPLTGIELNQTTMTVAKGTSGEALQVIYTPEDTTDDKTVTWTSKNEAIATVKDGVVTGKGVGTTTVTAKVGKFTAECAVTVNAPIQSISLSSTEEEILKNKSKTITVTVNPADTTDSKDVTWSFEGEEFAEMTVNEGGTSVTVKGLKQGTAKVTATSVANPKLKATCTIKVKEIPLESITMSKTSARLETKDTLQLSVTYNPEGTTDEKKVTWESKNSAVATVDQSGLVTAVSGGTTKIIAKAANGVTAECEIKVFIHTTGIAVTPNTIEVLKGQKAAEPLSVTFTPANTDDSKEVEWTSADKSIATVDENGYVTGKGVGTTTVTAKVGKFTAECTVTVKAPIQSIELNSDEEEILKNKSKTITVSVNPADTTDSKEVTWSIDKNDVAEMTVNEGGTSVTVKGLKQGTAVVTATSVANPKLKATCTIKVKEVPLESITMSKTSARLETKDTLQLSVTYNPEGTTDEKKVTWESKNSAVATVDQSGLVTAVSGGTTKIIAKAANGVTAECEIKVLIHTTGIAVTPNTIEVLKGQKAAEPLSVTFTPANTDDSKEVKWTSSDKSVATVDASGYVTGVKEGTVTVTATTADGKFSASCEVTVKEIHLENIALAKNTPSELLKGQKHTLVVVLNPIDTTDDVKFTYTSSDEDIAVVDENGVVTALKEGKSTITVTATVGENSWTDICELEVKEIPLESIAFKNKIETLEEGQKAQLEILFNPENATDDRTVVWSSSDTTVATIENGVLTALKAGKTTITAKVGDMEISYELTVTKKQVPDTDDKDNNKKPGTGVDESDPSKAPQTGNTNNMFSVMLVMLLALAAISAVIVKSRKRVHR